MPDLKWANVAHHYATSEIKVARVFHDEFLDYRIGRDAVNGSHDDFDYDAWHTWRRGLSDPMIKEMTPVLRHLEDLTREEVCYLVEHLFRWKRIEGLDFSFDVENCQISHSSADGVERWVDFWRLNLEIHEDGEIVDAICESLTVGTAATIHWLISKGFDVFGLIESGQAIRKEVQP